MTTCSHGIAAGTCNFCVAETLNAEAHALEDLRAVAAKAARSGPANRLNMSFRLLDRETVSVSISRFSAKPGIPPLGIGVIHFRLADWRTFRWLLEVVAPAGVLSWTGDSIIDAAYKNTRMT